MFYDLISEGVSIPLSKLASGYRPSGLIGNQVFPRVGSVLMNGKVPIFGKDAFKTYESLRARGARSNRIQITPDSWISFSTEEHDLAVPLDSRELDALRALAVDSQTAALFSLQDRQRRRVQWNLALEKEKAIADMVLNPDNYADTNKVTLAGNDQWNSGHANSTPITDIETGREAIRSLIGLYPNTLVLGSSAYEVLKFHPQYTSLMKLTNDKVVRPELIASVHDLKRVIIGQSMSLDMDNNLVDLWGDSALLCYIPDTQTPALDEPSFGYDIYPTFSPKPYPYVDIFTEEGGKIVNVRCTDMYDLIFTMANCGYLISDVKKG